LQIAAYTQALLWNKVNKADTSLNQDSPKYTITGQTRALKVSLFGIPDNHAIKCAFKEATQLKAFQEQESTDSSLLSQQQ